MAEGLLGKKLGMTQVYDAEGNVTPVTAIEVGPCVVMQVKTKDHDGYEAIQLGYDDRRRTAASKPATGLAKKAKTEPKKFIREVKPGGENYDVGQVLTVDLFKDGDMVDVIGTSKGHGFSGVIKRHGFKIGPRSHGSKSRREMGSTGHCEFPGRQFPGIRMAGHDGHARRTQQNLKVVQVIADDNVLLVKGSIPGPREGYVMIQRSKKTPAPSTKTKK